MKTIITLIALLFSLNTMAAEKEWTFLLFLNGNNNLDTFGAYNINQMESVGSSDQVNMVVQWASLENKKTQRLLVQKDENINAVTSPILQDLGNVDMGDYQVLQDFIKWGVENYPAKHYFVAVWDHGSGWHNISNMKTRGVHINDISFDDNTGNAINTKQLGEAIKYGSNLIGRKIDMYGSDACLMGMIDVAGEMTESVDYFVGSQALEPADGWPYDAVFKQLVENPTMSPKDLSKVLTHEYIRYYQTPGKQSSGTFSAFEMSKYSQFRNSVAQLGSEIQAMSSSDKSKVASVVSRTASFTYSDYGDFGDFLDKLKVTNTDTRLQSLDAAKAAMNELVFVNDVTREYSFAQGLSIWLPKSKYTYNQHQAKYKELVWDKDTLWSNALSSFLK